MREAVQKSVIREVESVLLFELGAGDGIVGSGESDSLQWDTALATIDIILWALGYLTAIIDKGYKLSGRGHTLKIYYKQARSTRFMIKRQLEAFGEKFDSDAAKTRFRNRDYGCPFDGRIVQCDKPNRTASKYGNCSACLGDRTRIICPRRFYEDDYRILHEIRDFIWGSEVQTDARNEVKLAKKKDNERFDYGNLDWILTPVEDPTRFIGVEIQSDATTGTGSFATAIDDLLNDRLKKRYTFGLNTLASFKGFLPQFIFKGQLFDEWKMPYIAVMQDELWEQFTSKFKIQTHEITSYSTETFMFFLYSLVEDQRYHIHRKKIMATRWVDLLFSFAVDGNLLINYEDAKKIIRTKINKSDPVSTF